MDYMLEAMLHIPACVVWKDVQGRFLGMNYAAERLLGMEWKRLKGKTDYDIFPPEMADRFREVDKEVVELGYARHDIVEQIIDAEGQLIQLRVSKSPIFDKHGNVLGVVLVGVLVQDEAMFDE